MEVWKEFFRLKREEMGEFFHDGEAVFSTILIIYLLSCVALVGYTSIYSFSTTLFIIYLAPLILFFAVGMVVLPIAIVYYVFIVPIKWLVSNWKQAKENVKEK